MSNRRRRDDDDDRPRDRPIDKPAGYNRNEAMAEAKDDLAQQIDESEGTYRAKPIELENEIAEPIVNGNLTEITQRSPDHEYCWVNFKAGNGFAVTQKLGMSIKLGGVKEPCWEVVKGSMKEASERTFADGTRVIGDTLLMRCKKEVYQAIARWEEKKALDRQRTLHIPSDLEVEAFSRTRGGRFFADLDQLPERVRDSLTRKMKATEMAKQLRDRRAA